LQAEAAGYIHVLNDNQIIIDGVRFLGSILWTDFLLFGEADKFFCYADRAARHDRFFDTRVVCNPRGYAPRALNPDFRPDWVIDV